MCVFISLRDHYFADVGTVDPVEEVKVDNSYQGTYISMTLLPAHRIKRS